MLNALIALGLLVAGIATFRQRVPKVVPRSIGRHPAKDLQSRSMDPESHRST